MKIFIIFIVFIFSILFSTSVDINIATRVAENFTNSRGIEFNIESIDPIERDEITYFYVFKLIDDGFVIVSAEDAVMPILAYSFENRFDDNMPVQVEYLFDVYRQDIDSSREENLLPTEEISNYWELYSAPFTYTPTRSVSPLLQCNWNQDSPWNNMCPEDQNGPGGNVYAGCVAISMAQVMYYWGYPEVGYGSHGYTPNGGYGYQYVDYGNTEYDYSDMEDNFATEASQLLIYHAGVAVNMGYSPDGSGAWVLSGSNSTYSAMKNYFIYDHSIDAIETNEYSTSQYRLLLQSDLDSNQPIIYRGCSNDGCHAWNIDGYEGEFFHNNFGWGGSNNGYYLLSALNGFNYDQGALINIVPETLDEPHIVLMDTEYFELEGDGDQVVNPGEIVAYLTTIENFTPWDDAEFVTLILESMSEDLEIINESLEIGSLNAGSEYTNLIPFGINVSESASLGLHPMKLHVMANDGLYVETFDIDLTVSLFQAGFPYDTFDQIKTNPLIVDLDSDNDNDIIFSDNMGFVHVVESDGTTTNSNYPYEIGDDVWGSIASADIDLDGDIEFVVTSKTMYIYIFDKDGLEDSYYAGKYLLGTPAIGQVDSDPYLEIVIGGFGPGSTSDNELFVVNHDMTDVLGFPFVVGEKLKAGVALADLNENGLDDIVFGTESDNIYLILDSSEISDGFPVLLDDKVQSEPSIIDFNGNKYILVGSKDDNFYSINLDGEILFSIETDGNIYSSPSFIDTEQGLMIFFSSEDGYIYSIDIDGNSFTGWPRYVGGEVIGSVVFSDIDGDGSEEVLASVNSKVVVLNQDGSDFIYSSILHDLPLSSAPTILDINGDGTLEVLVGTGTNLSSIDFKFESLGVSPWNMHRGNNLRNGFFTSSPNMQTGDVNQDLIVDILDIVILVNFAIGTTNPTDNEFYLSDLNSDDVIDILDVVVLINIILN